MRTAEESAILLGQAAGEVWAETTATASELVRCDALWASGFEGQLYDDPPNSACLRFVWAIRPDSRGELTAWADFWSEAFPRKSPKECDPLFILGFCEQAAIIWRAGHFVDELPPLPALDP